MLVVQLSRTAFLTAIAMIAFAANSLLCRMALGSGLIDAASFATIRVATGAGILAIIALARPGPRQSGCTGGSDAFSLYIKNKNVIPSTLQSFLTGDSPYLGS